MNIKLEVLLENAIFNITFFGGLLFIIAGFILNRYPPKRINTLYGYRTSNSMDNQEKWDFAQNYSSKEMIKSGIFLLSGSLLSFIVHFSDLINIIFGISSICLVVIIFYKRVEKAIDFNFKDLNRTDHNVYKK
jgi:uncharacterized membrane protein